MPIMVTYKFEENLIKNKCAMSVTRSIKDFFQGQVTLGEWFDLATLRTVRDFMSAAVTCKFEKPLKDRYKVKYRLISTQEQVTLRWIVLYDRISNSSNISRLSILGSEMCVLFSLSVLFRLSPALFVIMLQVTDYNNLSDVNTDTKPMPGITIWHRGLKLWISGGFNSRVMHYGCKNHAHTHTHKKWEY